MAATAAIQIGELSRRTSCNIETIRYFERVGIVATPPRTSGGRRVYGAGHVRVLGFIRGARFPGSWQHASNVPPGTTQADAVAALKKKQGAVVDDRVVRALEGTKYLCFGVGLCQVLQTLTNTYSSWKHRARA